MKDNNNDENYLHGVSRIALAPNNPSIFDFGNSSRVIFSSETAHAILGERSPNAIIVVPPVDEKTEKIEALEKQAGAIQETVSTHGTQLDGLQKEVQPITHFFIEERKRLQAATEQRVREVETGDAATAYDGKLLIFLNGFTLVRGGAVKIEHIVAMTLFALVRKRGICSHHDIAKALYGDGTPTPKDDRKRRIKSYVSKARRFLESHELKCRIEAYRGQGWMLED